MKSRPSCLEADASPNTEIDFQYMPARSHKPPLLSFKLALFCTWWKATKPRSALFEYVSRIFRSFAREDAGSMASGLWRWLVSVSSITAASFKLMHNRDPQSTFFPHCHLPPKCPRWRISAKKTQQNRGRVTEESRLHCSSSLIYTSGVMGLCRLAGQQWMEERRGWCCRSCQALTVHCVKLVIISSLKRCPVTVRPCRLPAPALSEAADRTLKQDVSVREVNLCCDGVANIMAGFIDTDCSDTSKSGPINLHTGGGVTGAVRAQRQYGRVTNVCLTSSTTDTVTPTEKRHQNHAVSSESFFFYKPHGLTY